MITIFSPMRPFHGNIGDVQLNAIRSWLAIRPPCEVILIDDEEGTTRGAIAGLDVQVISEVKRSRLGAPLLDDLLKTGAKFARHEIMAYITADVLLSPNCATEILKCHQLMQGRPYLAVGARVDLLRALTINFDHENWFDEVNSAVKSHGKPHGHTALDLWVYPRSLDFGCPPFPIGRCATDGWIVYKARRDGIPVIDVTQAISLVHQLHDRPATRSPLFHEEQLECVYLFDNIAENAMSLLDADWIFRDGMISRPKGLRRLHSMMSFFRPYRFLVGLRRKIMVPYLYRASPLRPRA
jgi:hypothetical protein